VTEQERRGTRLASTIIALLVVVGLLMSFNIWYTKRVSARASAAASEALRDSNHLWCALITGLDDNYRSAPADSLPVRTRQFAAQVHDIREGLDCPETSLPEPVRSGG
jgi:hypothetical protein